MRGALAILPVVGLIALACNSAEGKKCSADTDCDRGYICINQRCKQISCQTHKECLELSQTAICWLDKGVCTAIECGTGVGTCKPGFECKNYICVEQTPECTTDTDCQPGVTKCYKYKCVPVDYCESDTDCPSGHCDLITNRCVTVNDVAEDVVDAVETEEYVEEVVSCQPPENYTLDELLCLPCESDMDCLCGIGVCTQIADSTYCTVECSSNLDCPSGYLCTDSVCVPETGTCPACVPAQSPCPEGYTCDFSNSQCFPIPEWCAECKFDYQCGEGNRCWKPDPEQETGFCAPECSETYACPASSGCQIRDDGVFVCVPLSKECCYGIYCDTCNCEPPTPYCYEGECYECLEDSHCPPGKPICDPEKHVCVIQCPEDRPVRWQNPEDGQTYCVECVNSTDCPPGLFCGTEPTDPEHYHKCYTP